MAKKKAAKKTAAPRVKPRPAAVRLAAAEDAAIARKKEQQALRDTFKGIVREVLDEKSEDVRQSESPTFIYKLAQADTAYPAGPPPVVKPTGALQSHVEDLHKAVSGLSSAVNAIEDRLEPVMSGNAPTTASGIPGSAAPVSCQVSSGVAEAVARIGALRAQVDSLRDRLQV